MEDEADIKHNEEVVRIEKNLIACVLHSAELLSRERIEYNNWNFPSPCWGGGVNEEHGKGDGSAGPPRRILHNAIPRRVDAAWECG